MFFIRKVVDFMLFFSFNWMNNKSFYFVFYGELDLLISILKDA